MATTFPSSHVQFDSRKIQKAAFFARFLLREQSLGVPRQYEQRDSFGKIGLVGDPVPFDLVAGCLPGRRSGSVRPQAFYDARNDLLGHLLLNPVSRAFDEAGAMQAPARSFLHDLESARHLMDAPVVPAGDEQGRHLERAASKYLHVGFEVLFHPAPIP